MVKKTVRGIMKTEPDGSRCWVGYVDLDDTVDEIVNYPIEVLDQEDGTQNYWVLAKGTTIAPMTTQDLDELRAGELRRATIAKLSDAELSALGLTRS